MRGVHFLINEAGQKTAAIVDLGVHGDHWHLVRSLLEQASNSINQHGIDRFAESDQERAS